jgi:transketolase
MIPAKKDLKVIKREGKALTQDERTALEITALRVRQGIIESTYQAKSGHPGGSLSAADVLTYLYFKKMNIDPEHPDKSDRDRFVLSKGHAAPGLYSVLAQRGFFDPEELKSLRRPGSRLQGHPNMNLTPGVDMSTGSLGQGISTAVGMALGAKLKGQNIRVYALLGDGEIQEGQVWEAMMFASHYKLDNLLVLVDNNNLQIDGAITEVMSPYPIDEKLRAFGLAVQTIDGHDFDAMEQAFDAAEQIKGKPSAVILKTVKGKGVSFMENQVGWHGKAPNEEQYSEAMAQLSAALREKEGK